jgi:hypothetical protein
MVCHRDTESTENELEKQEFMNSSVEGTTVLNAAVAMAGNGNDFRAVLREMHLMQARTWRESSAHWRQMAKERFEADNVDAASFALVISDTAASYAAEEELAAERLGGKIEVGSLELEVGTHLAVSHHDQRAGGTPAVPGEGFAA